MGAGERLRESFPDVVVAAAEPLPGDPVMGLRSLDDGYVPPILDVTKLDRKLLVSNEDSVAAVRELLRLEGVFGGVSVRRGAPRRPAARRGARRGRRRRVLADGGWKYLCADFWERRGGRRGVDGDDRLVVIPAAVRSAIAEHARAELRTSPAGSSSSRRTWRSSTSRRRTQSPSPYLFELRLDPVAWADLERRGTSSRRSSTRTSPLRRGPPAPTSRTIGLWQGKPYVIYTLRHGRARRLADRGRLDRAAHTRVASAWLKPGTVSSTLRRRTLYATLKDPFMLLACGSHTNL